MSATVLRFLADESCDFAVVRALRGVGNDVVAVSEYAQRSRDDELIAQAYREKRILLTEDKDFGWLVFVSHADTAGVILFRFPGNARQTMAKAATSLVREQRASLYGAFVVMQPGYTRIGQKPEP
jgi:predicted nuclease of predicted toxin-antitoxin system